jgi:hypothetical protein
MAIMVQFQNKTFGYIRNDDLDELIEAGGIISFRRSSGWVQLGKDPVRARTVAVDYDGQERRGGALKMHCLKCEDFVDSLCRAKTCHSRVSLQGKATS